MLSQFDGSPRLKPVNGNDTVVDVAVVGAGFSGIGMATALRKAGADFIVLEKAAEVGGTWRDNVYPGCACDVNSHLYSFSFSPNAHWTRLFSTQPEIFQYLKGTVDRADLRRHMRFQAEVARADWLEPSKRWSIALKDGSRIDARIVVWATGALHVPSFAGVAGRERFVGPAFHSAQWRDDVDLSGKRVAVVGTGASAIQIVPEIVDKVARLTLYQRTPPWVVPKPDRPTRGWERWLFHHVPLAQRLLRGMIWSVDDFKATTLVNNSPLLARAEQAVRAQIGKKIRDPELRRKLIPDFRLGCKRVLISNDYYPALNKANVEVVTSPIETITEGGVQTARGEDPHDVIIYCTGYKPWSQTAEIAGRRNAQLSKAWGRSPKAYLGLATAGFPNLFFLMGPNTALGSGSIIYMVEAQIRYVMRLLAKMKQKSVEVVEMRPEVEDAFDADLQSRIGKAVWGSGCASWYKSTDGRNGAIWPGSSGQYKRRTETVDLAQYSHG